MAAVAVALTFVVASWFIVHPEAFVSPGPTLRPVSVGCSPMTCSSIVRRSSVPYVGHPNSCGIQGSQLVVGAAIGGEAYRAERYSCLRKTNADSHTKETDENRVARIVEITGKAVEFLQQKGEGDDLQHQFAALTSFLTGFNKCAIESGVNADEYDYIIGGLIKHVPECVRNPFKFPYYHKPIREPFDLFTWGNRFIRVVLMLEKSQFHGVENLHKIRDYLAKNENVFLFSNHQTEADPQVTSLLFEKEGFQDLSERLISVAGHRVTTDPVCMPFSMGRNLLCIYSKKYMENPPELKHAKQSHNMNTIQTIMDMLSDPKRGHLIWVAPSGGRDRPDPLTGRFNMSPFDAKSVEMFRIMAKKAEKSCPSHFFPMSMWSNKIVPPPPTVSTELGESRSISSRGPASIAIGPEIIQPGFKRLEFSRFVENAVKTAYDDLDDYHMHQN